MEETREELPISKLTNEQLEAILKETKLERYGRGKIGKELRKERRKSSKPRSRKRTIL
jgi:hypothetical protein